MYCRAHRDRNRIAAFVELPSPSPGCRKSRIHAYQPRRIRHIRIYHDRGRFLFFSTKPNQMRGKGGEREPRRACVYIYVGCTGHDGCGYAGWLEGVRVASILYRGVWEMCADGAEGSRRLPRSRWPEHDEHAYTVRPHGHAPPAYTRPPSSRLSVCTACTCDFEMNVRLLPRGSAPLGLARGGGHALTGVER